MLGLTASGEPVPAEIDGMRIPARFVRRARLAAGERGDLFVEAFAPVSESDPPAQSFTAVICDGGVHHYFHFSEAMVWLAALHGRFLPHTRLERIVFAWPWDNAAQNHVQRSVLSALYPAVAIADPGGVWPATYENVLVIDRSWHRSTINKFLEASLGFARPWAMAMGERARLAVGAGQGDADTRILYVPRPPPRCLTAPAEAALLGLLARYGPVTRCDFAAVPWEQQVRLAAAHTVLVGVHGNGLTNAMWMRPGSLVLELFPDGVRHYDYQVFAELCDLAYFGFERDRIFPAFSRTGEAYGHQAPTQRPVTSVPAASLARLLDGYCGPMARPQAAASSGLSSPPNENS